MKKMFNTLYTREQVKWFLYYHCDFNVSEVVYMLFAVSRNKLNKDKGGKERRISRVIRKLDKIDNVLDEIEVVMGSDNFYMYVSANPRSIKKASVDVLKRIADSLNTQDYEPLKRSDGLWTSALMKRHARYGRGVFMLDVDTKEESVLKVITDNFEVVKTRETFNGYHILVKPCNPKIVNELFGEKSDISIKKDDFIFLNSYIRRKQNAKTD